MTFRGFGCLLRWVSMSGLASDISGWLALMQFVEFAFRWLLGVYCYAVCMVGCVSRATCGCWVCLGCRFTVFVPTVCVGVIACLCLPL